METTKFPHLSVNYCGIILFLYALFFSFIVLYCIINGFGSMSVACWALCYLFLNKWRIQFKLASLTYKVIYTGTPSYLSERLHPYVPSRTLRSSSSANLHVPRTNLHFGSRSFHIAAPTVWNSLPSILRSSQTLNTFRKHLKTHLFQPAFNSP